MDILQLARCAAGMHHRDRRNARYDGAILRTHCKGCGKPMEKIGLRWRIVG